MNWLRRLMVGRYGVDQLSVACLIGVLLLLIIARWSMLAIFNWLALSLLVWCYYRIFSRQVNKRYQENSRFLRFFAPVTKFYRRLHQRLACVKTHRYFKCPQCKQELRVPKGKGEIEITCPKCHTKFRKRT